MSETDAQRRDRQARRVLDDWASRCPCGDGDADVTDCPGPPTAEDQAKVSAWIDGGMVGKAGRYPFDDPELWSDYLAEWGQA